MAVYASSAEGRAVFTVAPHSEGWAVEFEDQVLDPCRDKAEAIAAAHRRARACHDGGRAAQVRVFGEVSFADRTSIVRRAGNA